MIYFFYAALACVVAAIVAVAVMLYRELRNFEKSEMNILFIRVSTYGVLLVVVGYVFLSLWGLT